MLRYIGEELIKQRTNAGSDIEIYSNNRSADSSAATQGLSARAERIREELQLTGKDRVLFHVSPLNDIMPDLFDVVLTSECNLLIPERSAEVKKLAAIIADDNLNLIITSTREWVPIYEALNKQQRVKRLKLVLIDEDGNLLKRAAWVLRSLSAEKEDNPYLAYQKARGIWK